VARAAFYISGGCGVGGHHMHRSRPHRAQLGRPALPNAAVGKARTTSGLGTRTCPWARLSALWPTTALASRSTATAATRTTARCRWTTSTTRAWSTTGVRASHLGRNRLGPHHRARRLGRLTLAGIPLCSAARRNLSSCACNQMRRGKVQLGVQTAAASRTVRRLVAPMWRGCPARPGQGR